MSNPFLFDDTDDGGDVVADPASNPFLQEAAASDTEYPTENPFFSQQANNPFADYGSEKTEEDIRKNSIPSDAPTSNEYTIFNTQAAPADSSAASFFETTSANQDHQLNQYNSNVDVLNDNNEKKKAPPPRPTPPNQAAQELISTLADQLDQTSSHLLNRIPATRTPSPVSIRDLHSPSPTPECADLLDVTDNLDDMDSLNSVVPEQNSAFKSDNPFATVEDDSLYPTPAPEVVPTAVATQKPPPPRPTPPRPTPPRRPSPPHIAQSTPAPQQPQQNIQQPQAAGDIDLFDMFGTSQQPKQQQPKSNQDILSLFSAPKKEEILAQHDLLTSDNFPMYNQQQAAVPSALPEVKSMYNQQQAAVPSAVPEVKSMYNQQQQAAVPSAVPEVKSMYNQQQSAVPSAVLEVKPPRPPLPPVPPAPVPVQVKNVTPPEPVAHAPTVTDITSVTCEIAPEDIETQEPVIEEPEEITSSVPITEETVDITVSMADNLVINEAERSETYSDNSSAIESCIRTPEITTPYYTGTGGDSSGGYVEGRGQTPVSIDETANAYVNGASSYISPTLASNPFAAADDIPRQTKNSILSQDKDEFDAFAAKFDSVKKDDNALLDGFGASGYKSPLPSASAWGTEDIIAPAGNTAGFEAEEGFDSFLAMKAPPQQSFDDEPKDLNVFIRPKEDVAAFGTATAALAPPPPPSRASQNNSYYDDTSPRLGQSDRSNEALSDRTLPLSDETKMHRSDSQESPSTPLFDEDVSQPLEDFPRTNYTGDGWEMLLRQPNKKKITGQRFWKKIWLKIVYQGDTPVVQILNSAKDKDPFQELPLQGCYSVSEITAQPFDQFGKVFTLKLQYIFYKERPGLRPGQVTKAERITNKLSQFAAYAIQGDYQGVKEFGSDLKKLGLPVEHAPQVSQLFKIGSHNYEDLKQFSVCIEEHLFKFNVHRDRALTYKMEEVQVTAVDELYVEQNAEGQVLKQIARVRLFFLAFLSGMPTIELGVNDLWRQGKEVVGRHDIIPVVTEEWIRLEGVEFHLCVQQNEYEKSRLIRFQPPDACYIELMRFRVRPPKNRELPLQLKATWCVTGNKVELRADILVPGFASRKLGQIPCEDVSIRFPIPECWIYLFRVEKHFRYGSVKSAHRRTGKIKGIERILGTVDQVQESLIEVTSGQAKYEHHHRAIVWRCPRLPKEGQGAYTTHQMVVRMALTSYDQIPEQLAQYCYVEFTMPATQVSHCTVRSISVQDSDSDDPPEKYVRYLARHEYRVGIEHTQGESQNPYLAATTVKKEPVKELPPPVPEAVSESDSDSN